MYSRLLATHTVNGLNGYVMQGENCSDVYNDVKTRLTYEDDRSYAQRTGHDALVVVVVFVLPRASSFLPSSDYGSSGWAWYEPLSLMNPSALGSYDSLGLLCPSAGGPDPYTVAP